MSSFIKGALGENVDTPCDPGVAGQGICPSSSGVAALRGFRLNAKGYAIAIIASVVGDRSANCLIPAAHAVDLRAHSIKRRS
ncbi:MAG: hypothetical protein ACKV0T_25010 [Planctomycetales bacterium]